MEITEAIGCTLFESDDFGGWKVIKDGCSGTIRSNKTSAGLIEIRKVDSMYGESTIARAEQSRAEKLNCRIIGQMDNTIDHTFESANRVYDTDAIAPTVNTCGGGGLQPKVIEVKKMDKIICRMVGRDKYNPSHRGKANENYEQRLEPNTNGTSNTITSVQKDNLVLEQKTIKVRQATKQGFIECPLGGGW